MPRNRTRAALCVARPGSRRQLLVVRQGADHLFRTAGAVDRQELHRAGSGVDGLVVDGRGDMDQVPRLHAEELRGAAVLLQVRLDHLLPLAGKDEEDLLGARVVMTEVSLTRSE